VRAFAITSFVVLCAAAAAAVVPSPAAEADPYQVAAICTAFPGATGHRILVSGGGEELQAAIDRATPGDTIVLKPGETYRPKPDASFVLRNRPIPPGQWVVIRSADASFDAGGRRQEGVRVDASDAAVMPRIRSAGGNAPAIRAEAGAHGYRLVGIDVAPEDNVTALVNLIELGSGSDTSLDTEPHDVIIDRSYVHGNDDGNFRRGVLMNGARLAVIDSYVANFHDANTDSQAIAGWNGPGPFKIVNNYLEAASENIIFGGSDPAIPNLVPADIEIRGNVSTKRLAWREARMPVKNAFELKAARRVLVQGNTFEHVWQSGQDGTAILFKSDNSNGNCTECVTEYVTFRDNIVRGAANGLTINAAETGRKGMPLPKAANHIRIDNVLFEDIGPAWGRPGKLLRIMGGVSDVSITHVTSRSNPGGILDAKSSADVNPRFTFKFNIVERLNYGIGAGSDEGTKTLARNFSPYTYDENVIVNTSAGGSQVVSDSVLASRYPRGTTILHDWSEAAKFPHVGADLQAITQAQQSARAGDGCGQAAPRSPQR
jgi:hypothetical protein